LVPQRAASLPGSGADVVVVDGQNEPSERRRSVAAEHPDPALIGAQPGTASTGGGFVND